MWVEHLDIRGYKRLSGEYDFDQRLSVICGANEAGKSSMHDAVVRALFGFSRTERRRSGGESELDRCRPWNDDPYAIYATVRTDDGRLRLEWDFAEHSVTVRNLDSGEDLSAQMHGSRGDVLLGRHLLGLELDDFRQACCLDQAEISAVASSESLVVAMQRAVELGTTESGVDAADARLRDALSSDIGVRVDNLEPTRAGRLRGLLDRRDELHAELSRAAVTGEEIAERDAQLQGLLSERSQAEAEMLGVAQELLRAKEQALAERVRRAHEHSGRAHIDASEEPEESDEEQVAIASRIEELARLDNELAELRPQAEAARRTVEELEGRRQALSTEFDGLAGYAEVDTSVQGDVQGLVARRADLVAAVDEIGSEAPKPAPLPPEPAAPSHNTPLWVAAGIVAVASVLAGVAVTPAALVGLLVAALVGYMAARQRPPGAPATEVVRQVSAQRRQEAATRLEELNQELGRTLDSVGAGALPDLTQRARAYLTGCDKRERWVELRAELGEVRAELAAAREPIGDLERIERRKASLRETLTERYGALGIDAENLSAAEREFEQRVGQTRERAKQRAAAEEAAEGLRTALGGSTMAELEAEHETALARVRQHVEEHGELAIDVNAGQLADRDGELRESLRRMDIGLADLRAQIRDREERLPDVPALREEEERLEYEIEELTVIARAVGIARDALAQAAREAHRAFRPHLKAALDRNLARITNDRYRQVEIDDALNITVVAPETGRMVPASQLSHGTQDQIFYVERLEIIDLLDPTTGKAPLLVDEPFAHFDEDRLTAALQLMAEETSERQVMLFTCDQELVEAACRACGDPAVINLPAPE